MNRYSFVFVIGCGFLSVVFLTQMSGVMVFPAGKAAFPALVPCMVLAGYLTVYFGRREKGKAFVYHHQPLKIYARKYGLESLFLVGLLSWAALLIPIGRWSYFGLLYGGRYYLALAVVMGLSAWLGRAKWPAVVIGVSWYWAGVLAYCLSSILLAALSPVSVGYYPW